MITAETKKKLEHQHYKVIGSHSAVKLCMWTKRSLRDGGVCYKQKWYGIESHRCLQMTPSVFCPNSCVFCWRSMRGAVSKSIQGRADDPEEIIDGCIKGQRLLLNGFPGWEGTNMRKWKEAQNPTNAAISVTGEPTMYPRIAELIQGFRKRGMTTFLVTNGQFPGRLEEIKDNCEPTQLYISLDAPNSASYSAMDRPAFRDYWERFSRSLEMMSHFRCRKVLRFTLVSGNNMDDADGYAKLIEKANPDFLELKAYMHVGESRDRLPREAMPAFAEVKGFAEEVSKATGYRYKDEQKESRVVLLEK